MADSSLHGPSQEPKKERRKGFVVPPDGPFQDPVETPDKGFLNDSGFGSAYGSTRRGSGEEFEDEDEVTEKLSEDLKATMKINVPSPSTSGRRFSLPGAVPLKGRRSSVQPSLNRLIHLHTRDRTISQASGELMHTTSSGLASFDELQRQYPEKPETTHKAPGVTRNIYANVLTYSRQRMAMALKDSLYVWNTNALDLPIMNELCPSKAVDINSVALCPEGDFLVISLNQAEDGIEVYDISKQRRTSSFDIQNKTYALTWTENSILTCGSAEGKVTSHDVRTIESKLCHAYRYQGGMALTLQYTEDGRYLACGDDVGTVALWDTRMTNASIYQIRAMDGAILSVAWCPWEPEVIAIGGQSLAERARRGRIQLRDLVDMKLYSQRDVKREVTRLAWYRSMQELVIGLGNGSERSSEFIGIWSGTNLKKVWTLNAKHVVQDMVMMGNHRLVSLTWDDTLSTWDLSKPDEEDVPIQTKTTDEEEKLALKNWRRKKSVTNSAKKFSVTRNLFDAPLK